MNIRHNAIEKTTEFRTHRMKDAEFDTIRYVLFVMYYTMVNLNLRIQETQLQCRKIDSPMG